MSEAPRTGTRTSQSLRQALRLSPVLALLVVAAIQIPVALRTDLTPWKGGGFGMFSTLDDRASRVPRVFLLEGGARRELEVPLDSSAVQRLRLYPREGRFVEVARLMERQARRRWRRDGGPIVLSVELWRIKFDSASSQFDIRPWKRMQVTLEPPQAEPQTAPAAAK